MGNKKKTPPPNYGSSLLSSTYSFPPKVDINLISFSERCNFDYPHTGFESSCKGQLNNYLGLAGFAPDSGNIEVCKLELLASGMTFIFSFKVTCILYS